MRVTAEQNEPAPVDHAIATEQCQQCGAGRGVPCKVEVQGRLHDGAHRARLDAAQEGASK